MHWYLQTGFQTFPVFFRRDGYVTENHLVLLVLFQTGDILYDVKTRMANVLKVYI